MQQDPQTYFQSVYWPQNLENEIKQLKSRLINYPLDEIIEYLNYDNIESKTAAIRILGETKSIEALPELVKMFHATDNLLLKKEIIGALGKIKEPLAIKHLIKHFDIYPYRLKIATIKALALIGTKQSLDFFVDQLDKHDPYVKTALINAIAVIGDKSCLNILKNHLNDPDESVYGAVNQTIYLLEMGEHLSIDKIKELSQDLTSVITAEYDNPYISLMGLTEHKEKPVSEIAKKTSSESDKDIVGFDNLLLHKTRPKIEPTYDQFNPGYHSQFTEKPQKKEEEELQIFESVSEISIENKMDKVSLDEPLLNEAFTKEHYSNKEDEEEDAFFDPSVYMMNVDSEDVNYFDIKQESISEESMHYSEPRQAIYENDNSIAEIDLDKQFEQIELIAAEQEKELIEDEEEEDALKAVEFPDDMVLVQDEEVEEEVDQIEIEEEITDGSLDTIDFPDEILLAQDEEAEEEVDQIEIAQEITDGSLDTIEFPDEILLAQDEEAEEEVDQIEIAQEVTDGSLDTIDFPELESEEIQITVPIPEEEFSSVLLQPASEIIKKDTIIEYSPEKEKYYIELLSNGIMRDRRQAIRELSHSNSDEVFDLLVNIAYNDISIIRKDAIRSLANLPNNHKYRYLIELLDDNKWYIREEAARALGNLAYPDAYDPMQKLLNDDNKWVKETAIKALATINLQKAIEEIKIYLDSPDLNVKLAAESVLRVHEKKK